MAYSIEEFLKLGVSLSRTDFMLHANAECNRVDSIRMRMSMKDPKYYEINRYFDFIHESLFHFNTSKKPGGMPNHDFQRLKPIAEWQIKNKQLNQEALDVFE